MQIFHISNLLAIVSMQSRVTVSSLEQRTYKHVYIMELTNCMLRPMPEHAVVTKGSVDRISACPSVE